MGKSFVAQGRVTPKWMIRSGPKLNWSKILWMSSLPAKFDEAPIKNEVVIDRTTFSPLKVNGSFRLPWKPEFSSDMPQSFMQPIPYPNDASNTIWSRLATWPKRYSNLKVWTTDGRACGSGELKMSSGTFQLSHSMLNENIVAYS